MTARRRPAALSAVPTGAAADEGQTPHVEGYTVVDLPRAEILLRTGTWKALAAAARAGAADLAEPWGDLALRAADEVELRAHAADRAWQDDLARGMHPAGAGL